MCFSCCIGCSSRYTGCSSCCTGCSSSCTRCSSSCTRCSSSCTGCSNIFTVFFCNYTGCCTWCSYSCTGCLSFIFIFSKTIWRAAKYCKLKSNYISLFLDSSLFFSSISIFSPNCIIFIRVFITSHTQSQTHKCFELDEVVRCLQNRVFISKITGIQISRYHQNPAIHCRLKYYMYNLSNKLFYAFRLPSCL